MAISRSRTTTGAATTRPTTRGRWRRTSSAAATTARSIRSMRPACRRSWRLRLRLAGYRGVVVLLLVLLRMRQRARVAPGVARFGPPGRRMVWLGGCHAVRRRRSFTASRSIPTGLASVITLTGVWALMRAEEDRRSGDVRLLPWFLHGMALALLPWLHSRYALLAGCLGALVMLRLSSTKQCGGKAMAFLAVPPLSAIAWMTFFLVDLWRRRSFGAVWKRQRVFAWVHSRRTRRPAVRSTVRVDCQRAGPPRRHLPGW